MMRDLTNEMVRGQSFAPAARTPASSNGTGVDLRNTGPEVYVEVQVGAISGSTTLDLSLEESDDNSAFTAIPDSALTQITAQNQVVTKCVINRTKRYVRAVAVVATATSILFGVSLAGQKQSY